MVKLDFEKMISEIDDIVQTDFAFDMDCKLMPNSKEYTQKEAQDMAKMIGRIYLISHCNTCKACQGKYIKE